MFKKVLLGVLAVGVIAILIVGAVYRTSARASDGLSGGNGRRGDATSLDNSAGALGQGQLESGQRGQGGGRWNQPATGDTAGGAGLLNDEALTADGTPIEWKTVEGSVVSVTSALLTIKTPDGAAVEVEGQPWAWAQRLGFAPRVGDRLSLVGFDEAGEFKVAEMTDANNGQNVTLRDETGRPAWSGQGQGKNRR